MKKYAGLILIFLCIGCGGNTYLRPEAGCKPLSAFDTIVIAPFSADAAFIEEMRYKDLPRQIALAAPENLQSQLEEEHVFKKVVQSSKCSGHAVKIDGKIYSFTHHRGFHMGIRGQIVDCQTGEVLYRYDNNNEQDKRSSVLPVQVARKLSEGMKARMTCDGSD